LFSVDCILRRDGSHDSSREICPANKTPFEDDTSKSSDFPIVVGIDSCDIFILSKNNSIVSFTSIIARNIIYNVVVVIGIFAARDGLV
jgi:hypothetical protein